MCGLVGIVDLKSTDLSYSSSINNMLSSISHRGPDKTKSGFYENFFYGFNRLSIIDLSNNADQPFIDNLTISMSNCEIYNFKDLKKKNILNSYNFKSNSDAEVIPALYQKSGIKFLEQLDGMFALSLYDKSKKILFLARDRLGIKPLYYYLDDKHLVYSSEIKAILNTNIIKKEINLKSLNKYLLSGFVDRSESLINKIKLLPAGSFLQLNENNISINNYFTTPNKFKDFKDPKEILNGFDERLNQSVKSHLISDVPTSLMLSNGKDSNILNYKINKLNLNKFKTFTLGFDNFNKNEFFKEDDQSHTNLIMDFDYFYNNLDHFIKSIDQPTIDGLNTFLITKQISLNDYKVVLSGMGADELLGGYGTYKILPWIFSSAINKQGSIFLSNYLSYFADFKKSQKLKKISQSNNFENIYSVFRDYSNFDEVLNIKKIFNNHKLFSSNNNRRFQNTWRYIQELEIENYLQNRLLPDSDNFSMANSIELRVPFLSNSLIDYCLSIDFEKFKKIGYQKNILNCLYSNKIDSKIFNKNKQGFELPMNNWLKNKKMKDKILDSFNDNELNKIDSNFKPIMEKVWKLFMNNKINYEIVWKYFVLNNWMKNNKIII